MKRWLAALLLAAVLVAVVVTAAGLRWRDVADTLGNLRPGLVVAGLLVYGLSYVGRGLRLRVLMPGAGSLVQLTSVSARHIFLAVVLPFRAGEASLPLMLAGESGRPLAEGVSILGVMRILDLISVGAYLLTGLALAGVAGGGEGTLGGGAVGTRAGLLLAALVLGLLAMRPVCARLAVLGSSTHRLLAFLGRSAGHVAALAPGRLALAVLASLATWFCTYFACFLVLRAMDTPTALGALTAGTSFAASLVGTTGLHLAAVMPVSPVASLGTWEAGWTAGYTLVGYPTGEAASSAVVSHVLVFAYIVLMGGLGQLTRRPLVAPATRPAAD